MVHVIYSPPPAAACTATPTTVFAGEPVDVTATGTSFDAENKVIYHWISNGGSLNGKNDQTARIDTTGLAPGSYTASATITDPQMTKNGTVTCSASFNVAEKPRNPRQ
jgi:hypothetical protein